MYIWIACDVSCELNSIREKCKELNRSIGLDETAFSLPQHISLKISFEVSDEVYDDVIECINDYLRGESPFTVSGPRAELYGSILWLAFDETKTLSRIHNELDELLLKKYQVPLHEFDKSFKFHSTLFIDESPDLLKMHRHIAKIPMPKELRIDRFIIGSSPSGRAGDYNVVREINAKK